MSSLRVDSWRSLFSLLLWARERGVIPASLSTINDSWYENASIVEMSESRGFSPGFTQCSQSFEDNTHVSELTVCSNSLRPSIFAIQCHAEARGLTKKTGPRDLTMALNAQAPSIWISVASLGGLLWNPNPMLSSSISSNVSSKDDPLRWGDMLEPPLDGNSNIYNVFGGSVHRYGASSGGEGTELTIDRDMQADDFLHLSLQHSRAVDLFSQARSLEDTTLQELVVAVLDVLSDLTNRILRKHFHPPSQLSHLQNDAARNGVDASDSERSSFESGTSSNANLLKATDDHCWRELDAVMTLEWFTNVLQVNKAKLLFLWPKVHGNVCHVIPFFIVN